MNQEWKEERGSNISLSMVKKNGNLCKQVGGPDDCLSSEVFSGDKKNE